MEIQELKTIINEMAIQHAYPGFEMRSLKLGLPQRAVKSPARLFCLALKQGDPLVRLAALRWFQDRPGDAKRNVSSIAPILHDEDEWVRIEAVRAIEHVSDPDVQIIEEVAKLLLDSSIEVQKEAAKACGKFQCKSETVINLLKLAAQSKHTEVRWKSQKALRKLDMYSRPGD